MTEDEAKTKWCPMYRVATSGGEATSTYETDNRPENGEAVPGTSTGWSWRAIPGSVHPVAACMGSACMAWRSIEFDTTAEKIVAIKEHRRVHGSDLLTAKNAVEANWHPGGAQGYCGLAGAPR